MSRLNSFQNMINLRVKQLYLHQQDAFDDEESVSSLRELPLHIYLICRTPVIQFDREKTSIGESKIDFTFYSSLNGIRRDMKVSAVNYSHRPISRIESEYPYKILRALGPDNIEISYAKSNLLLKHLSRYNEIYHREFDLEVLYVGQAFGKDGSRITVDRLKSHEKAQKIYFDTQSKFPDSEIWFLALTFEPSLITLFQGASNNDEFEEDLEKQQELQMTPLSMDQQVTVMEATLIKYFNTYEYNKEYLNFPMPEHSSYNELYELDFNSVGFELTTNSIYSKLWSKSVKPAFAHFQSYFLHTDAERNEMFRWFRVE